MSNTFTRIENKEFREEVNTSYKEDRDAQYHLKMALEQDLSKIVNIKELAENAQKVQETSKSLGNVFTKALNALSDHVTTVQDQNEELSSKNREVVGLKKEVAAKDQQLWDMRSEQWDINQRLIEKESEVQQLMSNVSEKTNEIEDKDRHIISLRNELSALRMAFEIPREAKERRLA